MHDASIPVGVPTTIPPYSVSVTIGNQDGIVPGSTLIAIGGIKYKVVSVSNNTVTIEAYDGLEVDLTIPLEKVQKEAKTTFVPKYKF